MYTFLLWAGIKNNVMRKYYCLLFVSSLNVRCMCTSQTHTAADGAAMPTTVLVPPGSAKYSPTVSVRRLWKCKRTRQPLDHSFTHMDPRWKHPFTCIFAGPTGCGKTTFVARLLRNASTMIDASPVLVTWYYGE